MVILGWVRLGYIVILKNLDAFALNNNVKLRKCSKVIKVQKPKNSLIASLEVLISFVWKNLCEVNEVN